MNKKEREQDVEDAMDSALKHEENLQHDENEKPITYVTPEEIENSNHEEHVEQDENEDPITFAKESDNEN